MRSGANWLAIVTWHSVAGNYQPEPTSFVLFLSLVGSDLPVPLIVIFVHRLAFLFGEKHVAPVCFVSLPTSDHLAWVGPSTGARVRHAVLSAAQPSSLGFGRGWEGKTWRMAEPREKKDDCWFGPRSTLLVYANKNRAIVRGPNKSLPWQCILMEWYGKFSKKGTLGQGPTRENQKDVFMLRFWGGGGGEYLLGEEGVDSRGLLYHTVFLSGFVWLCICRFWEYSGHRVSLWRLFSICVKLGIAMRYRDW